MLAMHCSIVSSRCSTPIHTVLYILALLRIVPLEEDSNVAASIMRQGKRRQHNAGMTVAAAAGAEHSESSRAPVPAQPLLLAGTEQPVHRSRMTTKPTSRRPITGSRLWLALLLLAFSSTRTHSWGGGGLVAAAKRDTTITVTTEQVQAKEIARNYRRRLGASHSNANANNIVPERRKTSARQNADLTDDDDGTTDDDYTFGEEDDDKDGDDLVEEAMEIVEDIVDVFSGDNSTVTDVVEDVESFLGVDVSSNSASQEPKDARTAGTQTNTMTEPPSTSPPTLEPSAHKQEFDPDDGETEQDDVFDEDFYKKRPVAGKPTTTPTSVTIFATLLGIFAMIFTAWQMSDNPDGIFASLCRLIITSIQLLLRVLCTPCRKCMPCCFSYGSGSGYHEPYGHMPVSTMDYGYKDPALELS